MVFKQGVLKEEKIKFLIGYICTLFPLIFLDFLIGNESYEYKFTLFIVIFVPIHLITLALSLDALEWYYVYNDRIEFITLYGKINVVYFEKVIFIEKVKICPNCGELVRPHHVCESCGTYNKKEVLVKKEK